jgi:hypothetical protein
MGFDALIAIGSLLLPPVVDFVKKKWLAPGADTPEATMSTLATTKPDVLPQYLQAMTGWMQAQCSFFNRDVNGTPSQWVVDLRAVIRPIGTIGAGVILGVMVFMTLHGYKAPPETADTVVGVRYTCEAIVSSWFGDRLSVTK